MIKPVALAACGLLLAACSTAHHPARVVTVTVSRSNPAPSPSSSSASASASSTSTASAGAGPSGQAQPGSVTKLAGTCDSALPDYTVEHALGDVSLPGKHVFVVGKPARDIGRLAYLNCRYGVTSDAPATPKIEIGVSLYATRTDAATRISATVDDYTAHGATSADTTVAGSPATMLTGGTGPGYTVPLLVVASGQRTVAVSIDPSLANAAKITADAVQLAKVALQRTAP
jgi:hypothetical protein